MNIQSAYNEWSSTYDSDENRTRDLDQTVTRRRLGDLRFHSILEIGCGTGKNTAFLVQIGQHVQSVDFSEGMIARAKEKVRAENVRFSRMDISLPWQLEDQAFDLIVCNLVLEHIRDLHPVFAEAARTLQPGGMFFVNELHPFRQYDGKKARFNRKDETIEVDAFVHHISDFLLAAGENSLALVKLEEYWHEADTGKPPRILSLTFRRH